MNDYPITLFSMQIVIPRFFVMPFVGNEKNLIWLCSAGFSWFRKGCFPHAPLIILNV